MNRQATMALTLAILACGAAFIGGNEPQRKGDQYLEPAGSQMGVLQSLATANTEEFLPDDFNGSGNLCIPFGTQTELHMSGGSGTGVFVLTSSASFTGTNAAEDGCAITDAEGPDGDGACLFFGDGDRINQVPSWAQVESAIGGGQAKPGLCSKGKIAYRGGPLVYPSCSEDADCTNDAGISGATCLTVDTDPERRRRETQGCAYFLVGADTDATLFHLRFER